MKIIDLGWCIARLEKHKLTIMSPADSSEGFYQPAESIVVFGEEPLKALRDALNEAYSQ